MTAKFTFTEKHSVVLFWFYFNKSWYYLLAGEIYCILW